MTWKPIVAGVDDSPEARNAAAFASRLAAAAGSACHLIHATPNPWSELAAAQVALDFDRLSFDLVGFERDRIARELAPTVPPAVVSRLQVRLGRPGPVLADAVAEFEAELLVLGGKHHGVLARWLGGSTAHYCVRRGDVPTLITAGPGGRVRQVLVAVDLSNAAGPTLTAAARLARLFGARLRAMHVIEPLPSIAVPTAQLHDAEYVERTERALSEDIWPMLDDPTADVLVRRGLADETIAAVAREWHADVVVVGSHGRGWVDRFLLGSTTERLLNQLPTSMLVVPVHGPAGRAPFAHAIALEDAR